MLKYVIAMTNTALPLVLVVGVFLRVYRNRLDGRHRRPLWAGFLLGVLAAAVLVLLKKNTGFVVREYYNLALLLPTLAAELILIALLWIPFRNPMAGIPAKLFAATATVTLALWVAYSLPDALFYPYDFGVGLDTIFNTLYAYKVLGYAIGWLLAVLALYAVLAIAGRLSPTRAALLFQTMLLVAMARQLLSVLQFGIGRNLIPRTPYLVRLTIDWLNRASWFLYALMALAALTALAAYMRNRTRLFAAPNPALTRKLKATARQQRRWCAVLSLVLALCLLSVTVGLAYESREVVLDPPREMAVTDDAVLLPLAMIDDGALHRFRHQAPDGTEIRYIVIKKNETAYGVGLDACDVCGASGYYERNGQVICILCDVVMNKSTIGFPGGCNPVPLAYRVADGHMRIAIADLEKDLWRFRE